MILSPQDFQAIIVALNRGAFDYDNKSKYAASLYQKNDAEIFGQFSVEAKKLAVQFQREQRARIQNAADRDIIIACLRHTSGWHWEYAEKEVSRFSRDQRRAFAAAFGALADRIAAATNAPSAVRDKLN